MTIPDTVKRYLEQHNIQYELITHPVTYTSQDSARTSHIPDDHIAKAVMVKDEKGLAIVVVPASDWLKLNALNSETNRNFEMANENDFSSIFKDCKTGAVPALGQAYAIETCFDERLGSLANVYFEAGDHKHLVHINAEQFKVLFKGLRHGYFSH